MKNILIHYIPVENLEVHRDVNQVIGHQINQNQQFNVLELNTTLTGKDVFDSKEFLCEKINDNNNVKSFELISKKHLEDFKEQAPNNYENHYHITIPSFDGFREEIRPLYLCKKSNKKPLIQGCVCHFCYKDDWLKFKNFYRKMVLSINGKEFFEHYELFLNKTNDIYSDFFIIDTENEDTTHIL